MLGFQPDADPAMRQLQTVPHDAPVAILGDSNRVEVGELRAACGPAACYVWSL
jgi:hypothetical protein